MERHVYVNGCLLVQNYIHQDRPGGTCVYTHIYMEHGTPLNLDGSALGII